MQIAAARYVFDRDDKRKMLFAPAEKHLITIAPTGAGKFRSVLAAELLTYPGPVVCVDIKGESYDCPMGTIKR